MACHNTWPNCKEIATELIHLMCAKHSCREGVRFCMVPYSCLEFTIIHCINNQSCDDIMWIWLANMVVLPSCSVCMPPLLYISLCLTIKKVLGTLHCLLVPILPYCSAVPPLLVWNVAISVHSVIFHSCTDPSCLPSATSPRVSLAARDQMFSPSSDHTALPCTWEKLVSCPLQLIIALFQSCARGDY